MNLTDSEIMHLRIKGSVYVGLSRLAHVLKFLIQSTFANLVDLNQDLIRIKSDSGPTKNICLCRAALEKKV